MSDAPLLDIGSDVLARARELPLNNDTRLVVDAGGSTLRMAVCDVQGAQLCYERVVKPQEHFASLEEGLATFLVAHSKYRPSICVIGAAGPIDGDGNSVKITNNDRWPTFVAANAREKLQMAFYVYNDLVAAAACIPALTDNDLDVVYAARGLDASRCVMATLSTGVNAAMAMTTKTGAVTYVSGETGHVAFSARNEEELALLSWAWQHSHASLSYEDVISGSRGFEMVYQFVQEELGLAPNPETVHSAASARFKAPIISRAALEEGDKAACKTLQIMGPIIGTYLSSLVVGNLATGGVYLMGGISEHNALMKFFTEETGMIARYKDAGLMSHLTTSTPIHRVLHNDIGMLGATEIARKLP